MMLAKNWVFSGLLAASVFWAGAASAASEIRIAVSDIGAGSQPAGGGLIDVIYSRKLLEQEFGRDGISVRWLFIKGAGPVINEGFANHQIDVAYLGDLASIIGRSRGLDTQVIGAAARGINHYLAVARGADIHQLADLTGKRVGLFRGTAAELSFLAALHSQGLEAKDIKIINLDFAAASAALAAKQIDATWGGNNTLALRDKGLADIPVSTQALNGAGQLSGLILIDGEFARRNEDILRRIINVQRQAAAWASNEKNKTGFIQLLAKQSGYPETILREEWGGLPPLSQRLSPALDSDFKAQLQQSINIALEARLIRQPVNIDNWFDDSFLKTQ
ncbi:ABC transporter substrate-binding protein [Brenneria goodwinii]|uniref:Alkanesulfonates-binding protein n=1 Tax=Brenneria goodwinii TaxID=1109412 RepID=A0A0G4JQR0_9GAMM|nr:ABC transporter substrate-binding protein [Brenneria goodwinii]CPR14269.1 Alkanesulfonates-binding protein [Brenneria goodwinii]